MANCIINGKVLKPYDKMYLVSTSGDIYSNYANKFLKHNIDINGYHRVDIHGKHIKVHRLVYLVWKGDIEEGFVIRHLDDNKDNNSIDNLVLGTQKENIQDCITNNNRVGPVMYITLKDKHKNEVLTFCPAKEFFTYCGHTPANGSIKRLFKTNWFKERYCVIEFKKVKNINTFLQLKGVTTMGDECTSVE